MAFYVFKNWIKYCLNIMVEVRFIKSVLLDSLFKLKRNTKSKNSKVKFKNFKKCRTKNRTNIRINIDLRKFI